MLMPFFEAAPKLDGEVFVEASAKIIGDVHIGNQSSIWFNVVIRGDVNYIRIGERTNIQDGTMIHVTRETHPTVLGDEVTVGHNVTLHGCTIGSRCLIGIGAIILDGAVIGDDCLVAAGSLVSPGTQIPPGHLVLGSPARVKRPLSEAERAHLKISAQNYVGYMQHYFFLLETRSGKKG
ncbi:gamma carbonic anhydrase family protein [Geoalkalibacter halelectricus]|uniref:Gamma carbonic anhydrase family protein n=1 Tax=Geoalkalibacter halelectricus TaxID=2847045 RepID=A0ABY5ZMZ5_9BACT|nr:gamma carbonic anhydrase family protein [Geoalkalibacter halelectricus]MDO3379936.1 gamma carbonic anhydrase family protein [Geoalkalibacter halelectricus]UWZ80537.1 gamma carbonic anhydrase family protein [Geoalkalibacter halelectricus]